MKKVIRVLLLIFLIAWMLLIYSLSAETATESSDKSGGFSYKIAAIFVRHFEDLSTEEQQAIIEKMSFPIRKSAHFCIFAVLGVLAFFNMCFFDKLKPKSMYITAFCFGALYAASDEFHQKFVAGRSCEFRDWLIDCGGVLAGLLFCFLLVSILKGKTKNAGGVRNMRKKELISENRFISEELYKLKNDNDILRVELDSKSEEIKTLSMKIDELTLQLTKTEEKGEENAEVKENEETEESENILDYGASIIGKVIISAAEYCGRIDSDDQERVTAAVESIFERTEEVKSEILNIISSDDSYDKKSQLMEREYRSAVNYFDRTASRV